MPTAVRLLTADEFAAIPDEPGAILELVRGEIVRMSRPKPRHGKIASKLGRLIGNYAEAMKLGEVFAADTGFLLTRDPDTVRGPDVAFVSNERLALVTDPDDWYPVVPDFAVEVTSPDDRPAQIREKIADWLSAGVRLLWQAYPKTRTVAVHRPGAAPVTFGEADTLDGGDVLPGFRCRVADIFA